MTLALGVGPVAYGEDQDRPEQPRATFEWAEDGRGGLVAVVPPGAGVWAVVLFRSSLGTLRGEWRLEPVWLEGGTSTPLDVAYPREAYLHPTAEEYVTRLRPVAWVSEQVGGPAQRVEVPIRYLLWSRGPEGTPESMSEARMRAELPCGTVVPMEVPPGMVCRAAPPIADDVEATVNTGPPRERVTVPVDDGSEEVQP